LLENYSELRTAAYKTLILWLQQSLVLGGAQAEMDKLLSLILADVIPEKGSVSLRVSKFSVNEVTH
jgi:hypothetical protein